MRYYLLLSTLLAVAGCAPAPRYEFHTTSEGVVLYRCDRVTGKAWWWSVAAKDRAWRQISEPIDTPAVSQLDREIEELQRILPEEMDNFGGRLVAPAP